MNRTKLFLSAFCAVGLTTPNVWPQPPAREDPRVDVRKKTIEVGPKKLVAESAPAPREVVENPTVEPGKVKWHKSFADACAASKNSGKLVLLFQLMGQLDQQFT